MKNTPVATPTRTGPRRVNMKMKKIMKKRKMNNLPPLLDVKRLNIGLTNKRKYGILYLQNKERKLNLMKIIDKREQNTRFSDVPIGGTFTFLHTDEMGSGPYMRIYEVIDEEGLLLNAIDLEEGCPVNVGENVPVVLCNAQVIIN